MEVIITVESCSNIFNLIQILFIFENILIVTTTYFRIFLSKKHQNCWCSCSSLERLLFRNHFVCNYDKYQTKN